MVVEILLGVLIAAVGFLGYKMYENKEPKENDQGDKGIERSNKTVNLWALILFPVIIALFAYWQELTQYLFGALGFDEDDAIGSFNAFRPLFGSFMLITSITVSFLVIRWKFPTIDRYIAGLKFKTDFKNLSPEWKIGYTLLLILSFAAFVLWGAAMIST